MTEFLSELWLLWSSLWYRTPGYDTLGYSDCCSVLKPFETFLKLLNSHAPMENESLWWEEDYLSLNCWARLKFLRFPGFSSHELRELSQDLVRECGSFPVIHARTQEIWGKDIWPTLSAVLVLVVYALVCVCVSDYPCICVCVHACLWVCLCFCVPVRKEDDHWLTQNREKGVVH